MIRIHNRNLAYGKRQRFAVLLQVIRRSEMYYIREPVYRMRQGFYVLLPFIRS